MGSVSASLVDPEATLFLLSCGASRAEDAQHICDGLSKSYVALRNELLRSDAVHSAQFLEEQSQSVGAQLAEAEDELRRYKESNDGLEPQNLASMQSQEVAQFQAQRDQLEAERVALAGAIAGLDHGKGTQAYRDLASYPTFIRNPMVGDILNNLMTYENELHELQQRRTDTNIDVVNLRQRISELEQQLGRLATTYETALRGQIASLDQAAGRARGRLTAVPRQQMEVARLERESELLTQLYNTIQQKLKEAEIAKAVTLADVSIIDPSTLPTRPSSPDVRLNMILAVFGGLILGLLGALVQEFADTRVRRRYEVEQETGLPVLTMIPSVKGGRLVVGRSPKLLKGTASASKGGGLADYYPVGGELVVEAFRSLGADLDVMAGATPGRESTTAVFTSPSRGEGKTFNAVNFAATRAMEGYRTLLIDADLRSGAAGAALGLGQDAGLSDILSGEARLLDVVRMVKVANHRLAVLGAGSAPRDPSRLLGSEELDRILADAARHFQQVVIDTPPMNLVSDAALFAARADAVFIVVRSGQTDREALEMALNRLDRLGARALGIVLNDVKPTGEYVSSVYEPAAQAAAS